MGVVSTFGTPIALGGLGLVGLGTYAFLEGPGSGLALSFMIPGVFVVIAGMLVVSLAGRDTGLDCIY